MFALMQTFVIIGFSQSFGGTPPIINISFTTSNPGCNPSAAAIDAALGSATVSGGCGGGSLRVSDGAIQSAGCTRTQTRSWLAFDGCGNSSSASHTITWTVDVIAPIIILGANVSVNPDPGKQAATVNITQPTVLDSCTSGVASGVRSDQLALSDPYPIGVTAITWTATDACGNSSTKMQSITVVGDTQPPVITRCPVVGLQCFNQNSTYSVPTLIASDNVGIQSITFTISGATSRQGAGDASGLFNPGTSNILWTVKDFAGNASTCSTTVMTDKADAVIPDTFASSITPAIGSPNTIYLGFGGASITLTANATSSISPNSFTYKWTVDSPGGAIIGTTQAITVSPTVTTTFFVTISDVNNCTPPALLSKQVTVADIRCGGGKIVMCEPQKTGTPKSVCIPATKVNSAPPGSLLGPCTSLVTVRIDNVEEQMPKGALIIKAQPNPSAGAFEIQVSSTNDAEPILLKAFDITGKLIEVKQNIEPGQVIRMGKDYRPGIFMIVASQGDHVAVMKLVKTGN